MFRRSGILRSSLYVLALVAAITVPVRFAFAADAGGGGAGGGVGGIKLQYHTHYGATGNQIGPVLDVVNGGSDAVALSRLTIRYWFTPDGTAALRYSCDYTSRGCTNVTSRFVKMNSPVSNADTYLELGFSAGAGNLAAGRRTGEIQGRITKADWSGFDQRNDYSYDASKKVAADWERVTVYLDGALVWGSEPTSGGRPPGILHVSGQKVVDDADQPVTLRGINFGNEVWSNIALPNADRSEVDYQHVQDMGMNVIRFLMNYRTFEDDSAPGVWKESGFQWLDQNIAWAKAHGIRLELNMHVPQGGFQSNGTGVALWNDVSNQDRLTALWREIARRYHAEPTVFGYDLLNEPVTAGGKDQWVQLANRLVGAIREVDPWHIITVERLNGMNADGSGASQPPNDADMGFFVINDPNIMYEFHDYTPQEFTFQLATWVPCCQVPTSYPDPNAISVNWNNLTWQHSSLDGTPPADVLRVPDGTTPWTQYSVRYTVTDPTWSLGRPTFVSQKNAGTVYFDDFEVNEYDPQGNLVRQVTKTDMEDPASWYLWLDTSTPGATGTRVAGPDGHAGTSSVGISGTNTNAVLSNDANWFKVKVGDTYELKYWARGANSAAGSTSLGALEFYTSSVPVLGREKALLAADLDRYLAWGQAHNVPLYLGEWGTDRDSFARGGLQWVTDMLDLFATRNLAMWTYFSYRGDGAMGIYYDIYPTPVNPANANSALIDLLRRRLVQ